MNETINKSSWKWVPSLYFSQGLPYILANVVSVIMYKRMGISNADIAFYTGWLYLPWVFKFLWSPFVDVTKTKRFWILLTQFVMGTTFAAVGLSIPGDKFFVYTLIFFWLTAFASATHDIVADGYYMIVLKDHEQSFFIGIRNTFYRVAMVSGQGLLVIFAGYLETRLGNIARAWMMAFILASVVYLLFAIYHFFVLKKDAPVVNSETGSVWTGIKEAYVSFISKKQLGLMVAFVFFYRFGEAQLSKMISPFLLDSRDIGGLAISTEQIGIIYGTIGVIALIVGGILGGYLISRHGLKYWIFWMALCLKLPDLAYVLLSIYQPEDLWITGVAVVTEQFGYGIGFSSFAMFLIFMAQGNFKTTHFAFATGIMAAGMMIPGMISGWIQEQIGYTWFFVWVLFCTIPGLVMIPFLKIDANFGKKSTNDSQNT